MTRIDAVLVASTVAIIAGCIAQYPKLVSLDDEYFVVGGFDCARYEHVDDRDFPLVKVVECYNTDDKYTGKRYSMSDEELQVFLNKRSQERRAILEDSPDAPSRPNPYSSGACRPGSGC